MSEQRQTRRSRDDLRTLLLEAGVAILREEGLGSGADRITFKRAYDRIEAETGLRLSNGSVIGRIWDSVEEYQTDVLVSVAGAQLRPTAPATLEAVVDILGSADRTTAEGRARALREMARVATAANIAAYSESVELALWIAIWALSATGNLPDHAARVREALLREYNDATDAWMANYQVLVDLLGFRIRPPWTLRDFAVSAGAIIEGFSLRYRVEGPMGGIMLPTGADGEDQDWTLPALLMQAAIETFFEPDPSFVPPDDEAELALTAELVADATGGAA